MRERLQWFDPESDHLSSFQSQPAKGDGHRILYGGIPLEKVLIAEDDTVLRNFLYNRLKQHEDKFEVILASNGEEAIRVLEKKYISLLVTDIQMPKVDGLTLLSYINNKHPHIPCIVITGYPTEEIEKRLTKDSMHFLPKPFNLEEFTRAILRALDTEVPDGVLKGISVANFLQMIQMEEKTCIFEVSSPETGKGLFYFQEGVPYDAVYGDLRGEEAAFNIIVMERAEIRFRELPKKPIRKRIEMELMGLIMEAAKRKDDLNDSDA
jgi:CheY-like chemotaxis protein